MARVDTYLRWDDPDGLTKLQQRRVRWAQLNPRDAAWCRAWELENISIDTLMRQGPPGSDRIATSPRAIASALDPDSAGFKDRVASVDARGSNQTGVVVGFLAGGGWSIEKAGATGSSAGRPLKGRTRAATVGADLARRLPCRVAQAAAALRRGNSSFVAKRRRQHLAEAVADMLGGANAPNTAAFADVLGCSRSTIYALRRAGDAQFEKNYPKGGESAYWALRGWMFAGISRVNGRRTVLFAPPLKFPVTVRDRERRSA